MCTRIAAGPTILGDEIPAKERALELLDWWETELDACYEGRPSHPVFVALRETVVAKDVPKQPFADLLKAFRQDQVVKRYPTWEAVLDYCVYSANPVGRLVLYLCGYRDEERQAAFRRDVHGAATGEFLAGRFAGSGERADLYSAGSRRGARTEREGHCREEIRSAVCGADEGIDRVHAGIVREGHAAGEDGGRAS